MKIYSELTRKSDTEVYILFHGMFATSELLIMRKTKEYLLNKGYSVMVFDYPGHGKSEGDLNEVTLSDIIISTEDVLDSAKGFRNVYLLGFSFAGVPIIYHASKRNEISGIILFNPVSDILKLIFRKETQDDLDSHTTKHRNVKIGTKIRFFVECLKNNSYSQAGKIRCPVYVYHILGDGSVPVKQSWKLNAFVKSKKQFIFPEGTDHSMDSELKDGSYIKNILHDAVAWIKKAQ
jgi:esterase/lipase